MAGPVRDVGLFGRHTLDGVRIAMAIIVSRLLPASGEEDQPLMAKSAIRRHHIERLKRKRAKYRGHWRGSWFWRLYGDMPDDEVAFLVDTPTPCSCDACGNPRRHWGELPPQELRQLGGNSRQSRQVP